MCVQSRLFSAQIDSLFYDFTQSTNTFFFLHFISDKKAYRNCKNCSFVFKCLRGKFSHNSLLKWNVLMEKICHENAKEEKCLTETFTE